MITHYNRIKPLAFGLALGVLGGLTLFIMGLIASYYTYGKVFVSSLGVMYSGYVPTVKGSFMGGLMAFLDLFIFGVITAWLYNLFAGFYSKRK